MGGGRRVEIFRALVEGVEKSQEDICAIVWVIGIARFFYVFFMFFFFFLFFFF
jgi:hypothetical protein